MAQVDNVADGIYRISTWNPGFSITFNQFLIEDELPTLIHTGMFPMYEDVRKAVAEVLDPASLSYVVCPHFEADECGGMGRFVAEAPEAVLACSEAGALLNLTQWDYAGPVQGFRDGEVIDLGERKLRFIETPHVHHWDSMMVFEETTSSIFPAEEPVLRVVDGIEKLNPQWVHPMHGGSLPKEVLPSYTHALRNEPFGF